jgi:hypothetical protein
VIRFGNMPMFEETQSGLISIAARAGATQNVRIQKSKTKMTGAYVGIVNSSTGDSDHPKNDPITVFKVDSQSRPGVEYKCMVLVYVKDYPNGLYAVSQEKWNMSRFSDVMKNKAEIKCHCNCKDFFYGGAEANLMKKGGTLPVPSNHPGWKQHKYEDPKREQNKNNFFCKHMYFTLSFLFPLGINRIMSDCKKYNFDKKYGTIHSRLDKNASEALKKSEFYNNQLFMKDATRSVSKGIQMGSIPKAETERVMGTAVKKLVEGGLAAEKNTENMSSMFVDTPEQMEEISRTLPDTTEGTPVDVEKEFPVESPEVGVEPKETSVEPVIPPKPEIPQQERLIPETEESDEDRELPGTEKLIESNLFKFWSK